jgi:hypothetical protein
VRSVVAAAPLHADAPGLATERIRERTTGCGDGGCRIAIDLKDAFRKRHALSTAATARSSVRHGALFPSEAAASALVDDARRLQDEELSKLFVVPSAYVRLGRAPPYETEMCRVGEASLRREIQESQEAEAAMLRRCGVRSSKWPASRLPPRQQIDLDDQSPLAACDLALASRGASGVAARSACVGALLDHAASSRTGHARAVASEFEIPPGPPVGTRQEVAVVASRRATTRAPRRQHSPPAAAWAHSAQGATAPHPHRRVQL